MAAVPRSFERGHEAHELKRGSPQRTKGGGAREPAAHLADELVFPGSSREERACSAQ